ncbi:ATP-NAD kinase-like domain-containing protein [Collybia nuda]|uniref:ATP-NAD kinase-like domain-containing protein n=1 Tax=Collybia nuda TaxID=64659 RepID=A0A9P6CBH4_9AGAR|nr:ATP-NAD kinase-like domain-containing protein [Collybia nuda]
MPLFVLYNPVSGDGTAERFLRDHVVPILSQNGKIVDQVHATQSATHAGQLLINFLESRSLGDDEITVILCSGDGTLHDIVNALQSTTSDQSTVDLLTTHLNFVLVPCGTANALYASLFPLKDSDPSDAVYKLQSLHAYINKRLSGATPLVLARTTNMMAQKALSVTIALVVVSTSLHAAILRDSEILRNTMPGVERFKVAARNNVTTWYKSNVNLAPGTSMSTVQLYDPKVKAFITHPDSTTNGSKITLKGPFSYFLSTINVDRLEPKFQITSLAKVLPPTEISCDVVIVRPLRDPSMDKDNHDSRRLFSPKMWSILESAYQEGRHVDLRYDSKGEISIDGDGPTVVEYIRCGTWEWIPEIGSADLDADVLCSDGAISHIKSGGKVVFSVVNPDEGPILYTVST